MTTRHSFLLPAIALAAAISLAGTPAHAQLAAYESFSDYPAGSSILQQDGGTGFAGAWAGEGEVAGGGAGGVPIGLSALVLEHSLEYSDGLRTLVTSGGSLLLTGQYGSASLARAMDPAALPHGGEEPWSGKVTYLSFLLRRAGEAADPDSPAYGGNYPWGDNLYPRAAALKLAGRDGRQMRIGNLSNTSDNVWRITGEDLYGSDGRRDARSRTPFGGATAFVVVRIDHGGGGWQADRFRVWFNPVLAAEGVNAPPLLFDWTVRDDPRHIAPDWIGLTVGDGTGNRPHAEVIFDEFRLGASWEDVTPHTGGARWGAYPVLEGGDIHTGDRYLGWLAATDKADWAYSWTMDGWIHLPHYQVEPGGGWIYLPDVFSGESMPTIPDAPSTLLAYEGFGYPLEEAPNLTSGILAGGHGWASPWRGELASASTRAPVEHGSMEYTDQGGRRLQTSGHHAFVSGVPAQESGTINGFNTRVWRTLAEIPGGNPGSRLYLSFIGQRVGEPVDLDDPVWSDPQINPDGYPFGDNLYPRGAGVQIHPDDGSGTPDAHIGNLSNTSVNGWSFNSESTHIVDPLAFTEQAFVVLRLDYSAHQMPNLRGELVDLTGTTATLWINPADLSREDRGDAMREVVLLDAADPYKVAMQAIGISTLDQSYNRPVSAMRVDEIRVGTSWASVTPFIGQDPQRVDPRNPDFPATWAGFDVSREGHVHAGARLGHLWVGEAPWVYSYALRAWLYFAAQEPEDRDAWVFVHDG
jgi:hypothetical protein